MKKCRKCKIDKDCAKFSKYKRSKDGLKSYCKECTKIDSLKYRTENKELLREKSLVYSKENSDKIKKYLKSENRKKSKKRYYENNKKYVLDKSTLYYENNKDKVKIRNKEYMTNIKNDVVKNKKRKEKNNQRLKTWRIKNNHIISWRDLLRRTLKYFNNKKSNSTIIELGYSADELKEHIESLFIDGMSWNNRNKWHIDHIIPISKFNKETPVSIVNALSNLQPLWVVDNLKKGDRII